MPRKVASAPPPSFVLILLAGCAARPAAELRERSIPAAPSVVDAILEGFTPMVPSAPDLMRGIDAALELRQRSDVDLFLDGADPGELLEHATLTQTALNRGIFEPADLFQVGDDLFEYELRPENGLGNALAGRPGTQAGASPAPNLRRVHREDFGGPDSFSCATCHSKGGPDGAGHNTQNAYLRGDGDSTLGADERSPPHVLGLGPIEALAREMSRELETLRDNLAREAKERGQPLERELAAKGVSFGVLRAGADGSVDIQGVSGVDEDLVVKPFGWKGHQATLRGMVEESFRIHLGIVSMHDQARARDGGLPAAAIGDGEWYDVDRDGTTLEVDEGMLATMTAYLSQLETPAIRPPETPLLLDRFARGRALFSQAGCASCHRPYLELKDPILTLRPRGAEHAQSPELRIDVARDGDPPKIEPLDGRRSAYKVWLFSDLKRHDMGPRLATRDATYGVAPSAFLTRPLWGLAFTSPYLHDGRAPTVGDAIALHGGEAAAARDRYTALAPEDQAALQVFLLSLTREPKLVVP